MLNSKCLPHKAIRHLRIYLISFVGYTICTCTLLHYMFSVTITYLHYTDCNRPYCNAVKHSEILCLLYYLQNPQCSRQNPSPHQTTCCHQHFLYNKQFIFTISFPISTLMYLYQMMKVDVTCHVTHLQGWSQQTFPRPWLTRSRI